MRRLLKVNAALYGPKHQSGYEERFVYILFS